MNIDDGSPISCQNCWLVGVTRVDPSLCFKVGSLLDETDSSKQEGKVHYYVGSNSREQAIRRVSRKPKYPGSVKLIPEDG